MNAKSIGFGIMQTKRKKHSVVIEASAERKQELALKFFEQQSKTMAEDESTRVQVTFN